MKKFNSLSEQESWPWPSLSKRKTSGFIPITLKLRNSFPASAAIFDAMRAEETGHRNRRLALYKQKLGNHIPLIRRQDVSGFVHRRPVWLVRPLGLDKVADQVSAIEMETRRFYERAAARAADVNVRQLRIGLDAGAGLRLGDRDPTYLLCVSGRPCGLAWRRYQHGICGSAVG